MFLEEETASDRKHFDTAIAKAKRLRLVLLAMPKSLYRELFIKGLDAQIKAHTEKAATMRLPLHMILSLKALEELFAQLIAKKEDTPERKQTREGEEPDKDEDELTIPDATQPGEGVEDDDDEQPGEGVDEDGDNPAEAI